MQKRSSLCKDALFSVSMGTCSAWLKKKNKAKHKMHPSNQPNSTKITTKTIQLESLC